MRPGHEYPNGHCVSCYYFEAYFLKPKRQDAVKKGLCRCYAPRPDFVHRQIAWPEVLHDDWCGEYEKNE